MLPAGRPRARRPAGQAARAVVRVRASSDRPRGAHAAHAAGGAGLRRCSGGGGVPRAGLGDGAAAGACQAAHQADPDPLRGARPGSAAGTATAGAGGDLRLLRDRLVGRGAVPRRRARRPAARRTRGLGPRGPRHALPRACRRARPSSYLPLEEQDPATWDAQLIAEGEAYRRRATPGPLGRFQCEAAMQAVHCARARTGTAVTARLDGAAAGLARSTPLPATEP